MRVSFSFLSPSHIHFSATFSVEPLHFSRKLISVFQPHIRERRFTGSQFISFHFIDTSTTARRRSGETREFCPHPHLQILGAFPQLPLSHWVRLTPDSLSLSLSLALLFVLVTLTRPSLPLQELSATSEITPELDVASRRASSSKKSLMFMRYKIILLGT